MSQTIRVRNVSRRPQDIEGGRVLAHLEESQAPNSPHTRALLASGLLVELPARRTTAPRGGDA